MWTEQVRRRHMSLKLGHRSPIGGGEISRVKLVRAKDGVSRAKLFSLESSLV